MAKRYRTRLKIVNNVIRHSSLDVLAREKDREYHKTVRELYKKGVTSFRAWCRTIDTTQEYKGGCLFEDWERYAREDVSSVEWEFILYDEPSGQEI